MVRVAALRSGWARPDSRYDGRMTKWPVSEFLTERWARAWIRRQPFAGAPVTPYLLDALRPVAGERILDIGTGAGPVALAAAEAVGPQGYVLAIDISPYLAGYVRRLAAERGLRQLEVAEVNAAEAEMPGAPFDAVTSQMGAMFFADPLAAFQNIRRHLRPGGRLAMAAWAEADANPLHHDVLQALDHPGVARAISADGPGPFSLGDPAAARLMLAAAGFTDIRYGRIDTAVTVPGAAVYDEPGTPGVRARIAQYEVEPGLVQAPLAFWLYSATTAG